MFFKWQRAETAAAASAAAATVDQSGRGSFSDDINDEATRDDSNKENVRHSTLDSERCAAPQAAKSGAAQPSVPLVRPRKKSKKELLAEQKLREKVGVDASTHRRLV